MAIVFVNGYFGNAFLIVLSASGFYVEYCVNNLWFLVLISLPKNTTSYPNHITPACNG